MLDDMGCDEVVALVMEGRIGRVRIHSLKLSRAKYTSRFDNSELSVAMAICC